MKTSRKVIKKLSIGLAFLMVVVCTISDIYYSKLERDYVFLTDPLPVQGLIVDYKVHWRYSYITLNSTKRICVQPILMNAHEMRYFDDFIEVGDSIFKKENSDEIVIKKKGTDFLFINRKHPL